MRRLLTPKSLRGRVAFVATGAVAVVLLLVGAGTLASFAGRERDRVDASLEQSPVPDLLRAVGPPGVTDQTGSGMPPDVAGRPGEDPGPPVLRAQGRYVRVVVDGEAVRSLDAPDGLAVPDGPGFSTLSADGSQYRSLAREAGPGVLVETGVDLDESRSRVTELRNRLLLVGLAGVFLVAALGWWLAALALAPLARLRDEAGTVGSTEDLSRRIDPGQAPVEIDDLTAGINAMLARLEASAEETREALEVTRRFAGDAGHELRTPMTSIRANLGAIRRNPDLDQAELEAALDQIDRESGRMMRMLATLQTLARGDSSASMPSEPVNMSELLGSAVEGARRRHPQISWHLALSSREVAIEGWPDGLRAMVDNLLENAAAHGRSGGEVEVALSRQEERLVLTVDDDGSGIPADRRESVFERFERGDATTAEGSGLGLSLVRQQARTHGGDVEVMESPAGGARFEVSIAAAASLNRIDP